LKFFYDSEKTKEFETLLVERWSEPKPREKIHVSDIVHCLVGAWCRMNHIQKDPTKENIGMLIFGIIGGQVIQWAFPEDWCESETDLESTIFAHIDVFDKNLHSPYETKASRKKIFKASDVPPSWVDQLICYMTMKNSDIGWILILNVFSNQISAFRLELTANERLGQTIVMMERAAKLQKALKENNPELLPLKPEEYENCLFKRTCPRKIACKVAAKNLKTNDKNPLE